jgi:hypothetical protein
MFRQQRQYPATQQCQYTQDVSEQAASVNPMHGLLLVESICCNASVSACLT